MLVTILYNTIIDFFRIYKLYFIQTDLLIISNS